jgi:2-oxoisovalerate dehydrogenase E2 component (dihydrolipoyl transacylase)
MDTPNGLMVPNIKNVNRKSILEIAKDLERLKNLAQSGNLQPSDLTGGTITLSNIGSIGGTVLHPCLVHTELVIGAIGRIQTLPRYEEVKIDGKSKDVLIAKDIMECSWNADHRVVDGATLARFVIKWKAYLEYPSTLISELK